MSPDETMDVEAQIECLNRALRLQHRSVLMYSITAGSVIGLEYQAHADKMGKHAVSELEDATRLAEKITALGGQPTTDVGEFEFTGDPAKAIDRLVDCEPKRSRRSRRPSSRPGAKPPPRPLSTASST